MEITPLALELCTKGKNFASIATTMKDGSPQASVTWIDSDGSNIIFNTAEGRLKTNNLRRDGRVALTIVDSENPYRLVMIRGNVIEDTQEGASEHIDKLAKKYLDVDKYPHLQPGEVRVIFKIQPEKIFEINS